MAVTGGVSTVPEVLRQASWIWPENPWWDLYNCYAQLRKRFTLPTVPRRAVAYVTADQSYRLYVNGVSVSRGPARGFQTHWPYDEVPIAAYLREGENVVAIRAYNPGVGNYQYISQGAAGVLFALQVGRLRVVSDTSWKSRRQAGVQKDAVPASIQLFPQEIVDARLEPEGWMHPEFDDSTWQPPLISARFGGMPWPAMEERMIPLLRERDHLPRALLGVGEGVCAPGYERTRDVALLRGAEDLEHRPPPGAQAGDSARRPEVLEVGAGEPGRFRSYLLDFGRTVVGALELQVQGAGGGEIIDTLHVESIDRARLKPDLFVGAYCRMAFGSRLVCRPGATTHRFHHPYGFRYLVLTVRDNPVPIGVKLVLRGEGYPVERKGSFRGSDALLNDIWETCAWTQECCSLDAFVDTPWREQAQWWGDARVQGWTTFHLSGDARLTRRGLRCIAAQTTPDALTYGNAPTVAHNCVLPDFTLMWMLNLWDYWWQTGSLEAFQAHTPVVEGALGYFASQTDRRNGLVAYDPRYWLFLDWTGTFDGKAWTGTLFKEGFSSVYNLWVLITLERMAHLYRLARQPAVADTALSRARKLRAALGRFVDRRTGLVRDGDTVDGEPVRSTSVHAQTLAMIAGLEGRDEARMLREILLPAIRGEKTPHTQPSVAWCTYFFTVLAERGHGAEVVSFIRERWAPMVEQGTTFEIFDPFPGDSSRSHAWSAHPLYHLMQIIGGVRQAAPAWKKILYEPAFVGSEAEVTVPTPRGAVTSRWTRKGSTCDVSLTLPKGVVATARLPGRKPVRVSGRTRWSVEVGGP